jgi:hypothetical protein
MIPIQGTAAVLIAPSSPLQTSGYVPGNPLGAQTFNWYLYHLTAELNNLLTLGGVSQSTSVDTQVGTSVTNVARASIAILNCIVQTTGTSLNIPIGSGTVVINTGSSFSVNLPSAASALAASFEVEIRNNNSGAGGGSGSVLVLPLAGDYLADFLNGTWQITDQHGHVRLRPIIVSAGVYGWAVQSCSGTTYRNVIASNQTQSTPTQNTWYNKGGSLTLQPGVYDLSWSAVFGAQGGSTNVAYAVATLSTGNNSETDADFTASNENVAGAATSNVLIQASAFRRKTVIVATATTYYLNIETPTLNQSSVSFYAGAGEGNCIIEARRIG